jgi:hypothetical protein
VNERELKYILDEAVNPVSMFLYLYDYPSGHTPHPTLHININRLQ